MARIEQDYVEVDGTRVFYRRLAGDGPPTVFSHGNPTDSGDWVPFLERMRGPAIAFDYPGWGASARPSPRRFDYSMHGLGRFFGRVLDALEVEDYSLVVHDWGVVALVAAQAEPERLRRLVAINAVPLLPGYRWHRVARYLWRVPLVGELTNATTSRAALRFLAGRESHRAGVRQLPEELVDRIWRGLQPGTRPEILRLYRSADPDALAAAGARLRELRCPALVIWGKGDAYLPVRFGRAYAERLPNADFVELDDAGHWPWIERPELIERTISFLEDG